MNDTTTNFTPFVVSANISPDASLEFKIIKITIYVVIFVLTIVGNVLVISVIRYDKRMRGSSHILILNLAICDLITPSISIPFDLAYEELDYTWPFGGFMCKALWPCQTFTTTSSALILTAICIDRYRAFVYPFKVRWAGKFCLMIFTMYVFSIALVVPYILVLHLKEGAKSDCSEKWPSPQKSFRQAYTIVLCLSQYALPLIIMITLYAITLRSLFNSTKQFLSESSATKKGSQIQNKTREESRKELSLQELRKEQHLKVTKMFITVVIVFALSMFPNQVLWLWVDFWNLPNKEYFPVISIICRIFTYSNSVLNPFIYGLYSKEFRSGYKKAGKKISRANKQHQALYYHYHRTRKSNFQSSYISRGMRTVGEEKDLISTLKHSGNDSNPTSSNDDGKSKVEFEENIQETIDLQKKTPSSKEKVYSTDGKQLMPDNRVCLKDLIPESKQDPVLDLNVNDCTQIKRHGGIMSAIEQESKEEVGVEHDSLQNEVSLINNQKGSEYDIVTDDCKYVINEGNLGTDMAGHFEELTETRC